MKKCILYIVMAFVLSSFVFAALEPLDYDYLQLRTDITGAVEIIPTSGDYYVNTAVVNLTWVPDVTYRQEIMHLETDPKATVGDKINFFWESPKSNELNFKVIIGTKDYNEFRKVFEKIDFPLNDISGEYYDYLTPSEISDVTPKIRDLAANLVQGEDDLYGAVFNLAVWVEENIEYDLSSITVEASQKSSWVLENRRGVCDELTSLFISMCRSVGVPAKFVSGISYTNINPEEEEWGPHGWAEVYFPDVGWVPFDVTYKELGYLDATHIKLEESVDAQGASMHFSANGKNINIESRGLDTETSIIGKGNVLKSVISLEPEIFKSKVGFGSYNLLTVSATNKKNHYVPIMLKLGTPEEISVVGNDEKSLLLLPFEKKKAYFILKVAGSLKEGFKYTFPVIIEERRKGHAEISFEADANTGIYNLEYIQALISSEKDIKSKPYSANVSLNCTPSKDKIYLGETVTVDCVVYNKAGTILPYTSICYNGKCQNTRVEAFGNTSANFTKGFATIGVKNLAFKAENKEFIKTTYILVNVMDKPTLNITNVTYPEELGFGELGTLSFTLHRESAFPPDKAVVTVTHDLFEKVWVIDNIKKDNLFNLEFQGKNLKYKDNIFNIRVEYEDRQGNLYHDEETVEVNVVTDSFWQQILLLLNTWEMTLEGLFS
ncbi:MAG: transglutaminase-like domain-containing protein [archaeon]